MDTTKPSADAHPSQDRRRTEEKLAQLVEAYRHALLDADERLELRDRVLRLRRRLGL